MPQYVIKGSIVREAVTGEANPNLAGQLITVVSRGTTDAIPILEVGTLDPIPGSQLTVSTALTLPPFVIDTDLITGSVEDLYIDWYDPGPGTTGTIDADTITREIAKEARATAQAAEANTTGTVKSINGQVPDENGAITIIGGGGSGVLPLAEGAPVPSGTPSGTLIARAASVPPPGEMDVVEETATTFSSSAGSDVSLSLPSGIVTGDLLIAVITHATTSSTWTAPSGWVLLQNLNNANSDFRATAVYAYPVTGTPPSGTQTFTNNTSGRLGGAMFRVQGADLTTPLLVGGAVGSRATTTYTVPALTGSAGGLVLSVTNGQQSSTDDDPHPLVYSNALVPFVSFRTAPSGTGARTFLDIAWEMAEADFASHTVTAAGATITAMGAQVLALRSAA